MDRARVLIIDPDHAFRAALSSALEVCGHAVDHGLAARGRAADKTAQPPDLAIIDLARPQDTGAHRAGTETARQLAVGHCAVVFVTRYHDDELVRHAGQCGACGFFVKPVDALVLARSVPAWLARAAELRRLHQEQRGLLDALVDSRVIGTAVGMISERHRVSPEQAFDRLRRRARAERRTLADLAGRVARGQEQVLEPVPRD